MIVGVIADVRMGDVPVLVISVFVLILFQRATAQNDQPNRARIRWLQTADVHSVLAQAAALAKVGVSVSR